MVNMHIVFAVMLLLFTCFVVMLSLIMNYIDKLEDNHSSSSYSEKKWSVQYNVVIN